MSIKRFLSQRFSFLKTPIFYLYSVLDTLRRTKSAPKNWGHRNRFQGLPSSERGERRPWERSWHVLLYTSEWFILFWICLEQEPGPAMVLLVEQMLLTCCSSVSFVSKGRFSSFSLWFADKFDTDTEDWKPNFETAEMIKCSRCKASWDSTDFWSVFFWSYLRTNSLCKSYAAFRLGQETLQRPFRI